MSFEKCAFCCICPQNILLLSDPIFPSDIDSVSKYKGSFTEMAGAQRSVLLVKIRCYRESLEMRETSCISDLLLTCQLLSKLTVFHHSTSKI